MQRHDVIALALAVAGLLCAMSAEAQESEFNLLEVEPGAYTGIILEGSDDVTELQELVIGIDDDGSYVLREGVVRGACESEVAELKERIAHLEGRVAELEKRAYIEVVIPSPEMTEHERRMREECGNNWWCQPGCTYDGCNWTCCDGSRGCSSTLMGCPGGGAK